MSAVLVLVLWIELGWIETVLLDLGHNVQILWTESRRKSLGTKAET